MRSISWHKPARNAIARRSAMTTVSNTSKEGEPEKGGDGTASASLIVLKGVSKRYSTGTLALSEVNLTVRDGEFMSLLGPSGCGKTTLLRMIAGLGPVTAGSIDWRDHGDGPSGGADRDLGFVFQEPTLMPWKTVFNNVYLPLKLAGKGRAEAKEVIERALSLVGLENFANSHPRQLSHGMKMRVSIARALVARPRVLLLDEPFAALDEITRFLLNDELLALWRQHRWTVIFVTHSVFEAVYLSQRIVVMGGRPGRTVSEVHVSAPYPRDEGFRATSTYHEFCRLTSAEVGRAMRDSTQGH
jgi:NitT/TauT family transport system ATP-binding protein